MMWIAMVTTWFGCTSTGSTTDGATSSTSDTDTTTTDGTATGSTGETGTAPLGPWNLRTTVRQADDLERVATDPLCVSLYEDPGFKSAAVATSVLAEGGQLELLAIDTSDTNDGLLVEIEDCTGAPTTVLRSVAGVLPQHFDDLRKGEDYAHPLFIMTEDYDAAIRASLATLGAPLESDQGYLFGFVRDQTGAPIEGATVAIDVGAGPLTTYYADDTPADGLFGAGTTPNQGTTIGGESRWIVPVGPVAGLSASHPDYTFAPQANLSLPLEPRAVFVTFVGTPK